MALQSLACGLPTLDASGSLEPPTARNRAPTWDGTAVTMEMEMEIGVEVLNPMCVDDVEMEGLGCRPSPAPGWLYNELPVWEGAGLFDIERGFESLVFLESAQRDCIATLQGYNIAVEMSPPSQEHESLTASLSANADPVAAARAFTEPTRRVFAAGASNPESASASETDNDIESCLWRAWNSVIDVAADTPHDSQLPLIHIVLAVQMQNIADDEDASVITIWGGKVKVWEDMPLFGPAVREAWNRAPGTGNSNDFDAGQWCNVNAFLARLTDLSPAVPAFNFSLYALWTLRSACEETDEAAAANADAARLWFVYARDVIEKLSHGEKTFEGNIAKAGDKFGDMDWRGFNNQRLEIWRTALE